MHYVLAIIPTNNSRLGRQYKAFESAREAMKAAKESPYWNQFPEWVIHIFNTSGRALAINGRWWKITTGALIDIYNEAMQETGEMYIQV